MNTAFLLVLLTLGDGGEVSTAFVTTDSLLACQTKSKMLGAVISGVGTKVLENSCFSSDLVFSKFDHHEKDPTDYHYVISLVDNTVKVIPMKSKMACILGQEKTALKNKNSIVYKFRREISKNLRK